MVFFCLIMDSEHWILFLTRTAHTPSPICKQSRGWERPSPGWGPRRSLWNKGQDTLFQCPVPTAWVTGGLGEAADAPLEKPSFRNPLWKIEDLWPFTTIRPSPLHSPLVQFGVSKGTTLKSRFDESSATGTKTLCFVCKMRINSTGTQEEEGEEGHLPSLEMKAMTNIDSILKSRDITLPTKVCQKSKLWFFR